MKKTIKLTERDLTNLVKRILNEQGRNRFSDMSDEEIEDWLDNFGRQPLPPPLPTPPPTQRRMPEPMQEPKKGFDDDYTTFNGSNMGLDSFPEELLDYADTLVTIILSNNNITEIPEWISEFKNLEILNLRENPISHIPNSISELDGNLYRVSIDNHKEKLKKLLPNTLIG